METADTLDGCDVHDPEPDPGDDRPFDAYLGLRPHRGPRRGRVPDLRRVQSRPRDYPLARG